MKLSPDELKTLANQSAWNIAERFGCQYSGDGNAIDHGGYFYDARDWEHGYASCVEFWIDPESKGETLCVTLGTINKCDDMASALACIGHTGELSDHVEIEACQAYAGIEPDSTRTYRLADWKEWRIWKSLQDSLASLGSVE